VELSQRPIRCLWSTHGGRLAGSSPQCAMFHLPALHLATPVPALHVLCTSLMVQAAMAKQAATREAQFQAMYAEVVEGIACSQGVMREAHEVVERTGRVQRDKQRQLYQSWSTEVFDKIQVCACGSPIQGSVVVALHLVR
jgi:hypothetical protein